jgi:hypothetical protein
MGGAAPFPYAPPGLHHPDQPGGTARRAKRLGGLEAALPGFRQPCCPVRHDAHRPPLVRHGFILYTVFHVKVFAQFITVCRRSKWSTHRTKSPLRAFR